MKDRIFIDTNIFLYSILDEKTKDKDNEQKVKAAKALIESINADSELVVSAQILNEIYVNLLKHKVAEKDIINSINAIVVSSNQLVAIDFKLLQVGWELKQKYKLSYWDSLVAAAASLSDCKILYSEDMQDGLVINKKLKITNPLPIK